MNKLLTFFFILPFLSCSTETERPVDPALVGQWVLTETSGQFAGSKRTGSEMPFQETYYLEADGSFLKVRYIQGEELKVEGNFALTDTGSTITEEGIIAFVQFEHGSLNPIIANCSSTLTEHMYLTSGQKLVSTYEACDGLGLQYQKLR